MSEVIFITVAANPKRMTSAARERFAKYEEGMTVAEAKAAGITARDLRYDQSRNYIVLIEMERVLKVAARARFADWDGTADTVTINGEGAE